MESLVVNCGLSLVRDILRGHSPAHYVQMKGKDLGGIQGDGMPGVIFCFLFPGDMMNILAVDFKATELKHTAIQESP